MGLWRGPVQGKRGGSPRAGRRGRLLCGAPGGERGPPLSAAEALFSPSGLGPCSALPASASRAPGPPPRAHSSPLCSPVAVKKLARAPPPAHTRPPQFRNAGATCQLTGIHSASFAFSVGSIIIQRQKENRARGMYKRQWSQYLWHWTGSGVMRCVYGSIVRLSLVEQRRMLDSAAPAGARRVLGCQGGGRACGAMSGLGRKRAGNCACHASGT